MSVILKLFKDDVSMAEITYYINMVLEKIRNDLEILEPDGISQFRTSRLFS
jgi:hypothetical protein